MNPSERNREIRVFGFAAGVFIWSAAHGIPVDTVIEQIGHYGLETIGLIVAVRLGSQGFNIHPFRHASRIDKLPRKGT